MPKPDGSLSAVVVSGGKQYRVAPGDQILVDRLAAAPGSSLKLGRVLLFAHGTEIKVGSPDIEGMDVDIKVLAHRRGPRLESLRYKSKKRVRVHHGGRADLTAVEIISIGGFTKEEGAEKPAKAGKPKGKQVSKKAAAKPRAAAAETKVETASAAKPKARATRKKEPE